MVRCGRGPRGARPPAGMGAGGGGGGGEISGSVKESDGVIQGHPVRKGRAID